MATSLFPDPQPGTTALTTGEPLAPPAPHLVSLLIEARRFVARGTTRHRLVYCPACHRRCRLPDGATRCAFCVSAAIDWALRQPVASERGWSRDAPACRTCGTTARPHQAHGECTRCWAARKRRERAA